MSFVNKTVRHSKDGYGTIKSFRDNNNTFVVQFNNGVERIYNYPDDFDNSVLSIEDNELQNKIEQDIKIKNGEIVNYIFNGKSLYGKSDSKPNGAITEDPLLAIGLKKGISYGVNAQKIYQALCDNKHFNWNQKNASKFAKQQSLYSKNCTNNGYSVWFVAYSSYNLSKNENRGVANNIEENNDIYEEWDIGAGGPPAEDSDEIKIVFVKNKKGQYEFWGVMITKIEDVNKEKEPYYVYNHHISDDFYPDVQY